MAWITYLFWQITLQEAEQTLPRAIATLLHKMHNGDKTEQ